MHALHYANELFVRVRFSVQKLLTNSLNMQTQHNDYVIKQMVNAIVACTIELWMHLGGLLSTQEARVARGDTLLSCLATSRVHP